MLYGPSDSRTLLVLQVCCSVLVKFHHHHTTTVLRPFFRDHPGEPVPEENFWTLWRNGRLTEADTLTIRLGCTPSRLTSAHLHHPPIFLHTGCPSCRPTNSVKALKATSAFGLGIKFHHSGVIIVMWIRMRFQRLLVLNVSCFGC